MFDHRHPYAVFSDLCCPLFPYAIALEAHMVYTANLSNALGSMQVSLHSGSTIDYIILSELLQINLHIIDAYFKRLAFAHK